MKNEDLVLLIGMMLHHLGGEIKISAEAQLSFSEGMTKKEILFKEDPENKFITIKLAEKEAAEKQK